jgi:hypothetical protein
VSYWTAGTNDGINCERTWGWCPDSTAIVSDLWNANEPNTPFGEQCAAWQYNPSDYSKSGIYDLSCSSSQRFICEVNLKKTKGPTCDMFQINYTQKGRGARVLTNLPDDGMQKNREYLIHAKHF